MINKKNIKVGITIGDINGIGPEVTLKALKDARILSSFTPIIYGSYSTFMFPVIPDGEETVTHDTLGKDKINPDKIFNKLISLID